MTMLRPEYLVVVIGLVLGYWIVSRYLSRTPGAKGSPVQGEHPSQNTPDASPPSQPMPWDSVLGVLESASVEEIRKAYKFLMSQYHPDKLIGQGLPAGMIKAATERSQEIQAAYDCVKKSRG